MGPSSSADDSDEASPSSLSPFFLASLQPGRPFLRAGGIVSRRKWLFCSASRPLLLLLPPPTNVPDNLGLTFSGCQSLDWVEEAEVAAKRQTYVSK